MDALTNPVVLAVLFVIGISPVAMLVIRYTLEGGKPGGIFDPRTQSWAFLFGDTFALPLALGSATDAVREVSWYKDWRWVAVSLLIATVVTIGFRYMEVSNYTRSGNADRLYAPTKIWHDMVVYPIVGFGLLWIGIPAILTGTTSGWLTLAGFLAWLALGGCDLVRGLEPAYMHPRVQDTRLRKLFR